LTEGGAVGIQVGLGFGDLLVVLGGIAEGVVDEESDGRQEARNGFSASG
jgi:hypothetical protein